MEDQIMTLIRNSGPSRIANEIANLLMYSIRMRLSAAHEEALEIGASKVGGLPDLPPEIHWPEWNGVPLSFVAQIHLPDIASYDREGALPHTGMLYFFYEAEEQPWGYDPAHRGGCRVFYDNGDPSRLRRTPAPATLPARSRFTPAAIEFSLELTLPDIESPVFEQLGLTWETIYANPATPELRDEGECYLQLCQELAKLYEREGEHYLRHRLLGHPDTIQGDMQLECEGVSQGLNMGFGPPDWRERDAMLKKTEEQWRLLLQVDSEETTGMWWGEGGRIYFWIPRQALAARDFEQVWLILQCT